MPSKLRIKIEFEELYRHLDHKIRIDFGKVDQQAMEYSIWCDNCQETIGNTIERK